MSAEELDERQLLIDQINHWAVDQAAFIRDVFKVEPDRWQHEAGRAIVEHDRVSIRSGHGVGKSSWLSWTVIWWLMTRFPSKVACTAPTAHQLSDVLWGEIAKWVRKMDPALQALIEVKQDQVVLRASPKEGFAVARTARKEQPEAFQGFHCLSEDHEILTNEGWLGLDKIRSDHLVLSQPLNCDESQWMPIEAIHAYPFVGSLNVYESANVSFAVTDEHRFPTKYLERVKKWKMRRLSEMAGQFMVKRTSTWCGEDFDIPEPCRGLGLSKADFARFVGLWLSEGGTRPHSNGKADYEVLLYQTKPAGCAYIEGVVGGAGFKRYKDFYWRSDRWLAQWLKDNCGSSMTEKRIPPFLKNATPEILDALLEGLWAGDGSFREDGSRGQYYSTSKQLIDDVQEILLKIGHVGSIGINRAAGSVANSGARTLNTCYVTTCTKRSTDHIVKTNRIRKEPYSGKVWCISTPYQTFFTRRNGKVFLSGNSESMMFIVDEASGVEDIIFEVGRGAMSTKGAKTILVGNPTRTSGFFYDTHNRLRSRWYTMRVSCEDSAMVDPGFIEEMEHQYGRDSNIFRVRVLGDFPESEDQQVIPLHLVEAAVQRDVVMADGRVIWGLDVARFGDDRTCLCKRQKNYLLEPPVSWKGKDLMQTAGMIVKVYNETPIALRPDVINVDSIGVGAGVVDALRHEGLPVRGVNVAEVPAVGEKYQRLRDELWWRAREWFEERDSWLPGGCDKLIEELTLPRYDIAPNGKVKVESKSDIKKRLPHSPDLADAFCLTFASNDRRISGRMPERDLRMFV